MIDFKVKMSHLTQRLKYEYHVLLFPLFFHLLLLLLLLPTHNCKSNWFIFMYLFSFPKFNSTLKS